MPKAVKIIIALVLSAVAGAVAAWGYVPLNLHLHQYYYVTRMPHRRHTYPYLTLLMEHQLHEDDLGALASINGYRISYDYNGGISASYRTIIKGRDLLKMGDYFEITDSLLSYSLDSSDFENARNTVDLYFDDRGRLESFDRKGTGRDVPVSRFWPLLDQVEDQLQKNSSRPLISLQDQFDRQFRKQYRE
ncbi:hypothetical protein [Limosilactobacillus antri]|uniref:hypothetical protein n=1 Tax=Limosilactobacillus antri TaxID=227943 RepID=UPI001F592699|nr:hypothetical protein [Limosilactobacillus antri]